MDTFDIPVTAFVAAAAVVLTILWQWIKNRSVPPGPTGIPYLGMYPFFTEENVNQKMAEYKEQYGDIFSFKYTGRLFINLGSIKAMRELHVGKSDCFADRFTDANAMTEMLRNGLTFVNGEPWRVYRKFFVQKFKEYGLNTVRDEMAGPVYDSLNATIEDIKASEDKPVNIVELLGKRCAVTMRKVIFGDDGVSNDDLLTMITSYAGALEGNDGLNLLLIGPVARLLFWTKSNFRKNFRMHKDLLQVTMKCAKIIEASAHEEHRRCIIADFYKERDNRRRKNDPTWKYFTDEALVETVIQFVGDGILAVAGFIGGLFATLLEYPDEQDKLYQEIVEVVGGNRQPTLEDRNNMLYTCAFISECIRTTKFLRFFPSLECTKETTVRGYTIPKGSITVLNFWSAHHDPDVFEDPHVFNPSRYMSIDGKPKAESPVLFGMGKRSCTGEPFVMMQCFLFFTTVLQTFKIVSSNFSTENSMDFFVTGKLQISFVRRTEA